MRETQFQKWKRRADWHRLIHKAQKRPTICVFAPMFTPENERDGYIQRIRSIDETLLTGYDRVYLMGDHPELPEETITRFDPRHVYIRFNSADPRQLERVLALVSAAGRTLIHSVYRFMAGYVAPEMRRVLDLDGVEHFWDVHGAVPEECRLNGDPGIAAVAEEIEEKLYQKARVILCVSRAMIGHLREKYGESAGRVICAPIMTPEEAGGEVYRPRTEPGGKPVVVYSGGLQSWQNIPAMLDLISETADRFSYRLFVPDPEALRNAWGDRPGWESVHAATAAPEELGREYDRCQYGLLLREDIAVNRVACPTKLIEYIAHGVVPVMRSTRVGDFVELGMRYVSEADLRNGCLPTEEERRRMQEQNRLVLTEMRQQFSSGIHSVRSMFS